MSAFILRLVNESCLFFGDSMLSVIDMSGTLHLFDVESESGKAKPIDFQRRDVWDVRWAWVSI